MPLREPLAYHAGERRSARDKLFGRGISIPVRFIVRNFGREIPPLSLKRRAHVPRRAETILARSL